MLLRDWIYNNGYTQRQAASLLGISAGYLCAIVTGERRPSTRLANDIERLTAIPAAKLLTGHATGYIGPRLRQKKYHLRDTTK